MSKWTFIYPFWVSVVCIYPIIYYVYCLSITISITIKGHFPYYNLGFNPTLGSLPSYNFISKQQTNSISITLHGKKKPSSSFLVNPHNF
jgi:hypothetical protein